MKFYSNLFGWKVVDWKPDRAAPEVPTYTMFQVGKAAFAGVNQLPNEGETPAHWMGHIQVDDLDQAVERAQKLGAKFPMVTREIVTVGRMAIMVDPENCVCSLFQPASDMPGAVGPSAHGAVGWNEIGVDDVDKSKAFYSEIVGWKWREGPNPEVMPYHLFGTGEVNGDAGGLYKRPDNVPVSTWMVYFTTHDLSATMGTIKESGGQIMGDIFDVPGTGKMAVASAPDGSVFGVAQWSLPG